MGCLLFGINDKLVVWVACTIKFGEGRVLYGYHDIFIQLKCAYKGEFYLLRCAKIRKKLKFLYEYV